MKKLLFVIVFFVSIASFAQEKSEKSEVKDTTIAITMPLEQFKVLLYTIDQSIDSKKVSKELIEFLQKSAAIVPNKQKEITQKGKQ